MTAAGKGTVNVSVSAEPITVQVSAEEAIEAAVERAIKGAIGGSLTSDLDQVEKIDLKVSEFTVDGDEFAVAAAMSRDF